MKLYYYLHGDAIIDDARIVIDEAQELANESTNPVEIYNWAPGCHKHDSLYLYMTPVQ